MGSDKELDPLAFDDEMPQHRLYLPEYRIAGCPVTNADVKHFVDATVPRKPVTLAPRPYSARQRAAPGGPRYLA